MATPKIGRSLERGKVEFTDPTFTPRVSQPVGIHTVPAPQVTQFSLPTEQEELDAAARLILDKLPSHIRDFAHECALIINRIPLWALVAGHVLLAYENGALPTTRLDPGWPREWNGVLPVYTQECEACHRTFEARRIGQRACSTACGVEVARMDTGEGPVMTPA